MPHVLHAGSLEGFADVAEQGGVLLFHSVGADFLDAGQLILQFAVEFPADADHLIPVGAGFLPQGLEDHQHACAHQAHQCRDRQAHHQGNGQLHRCGYNAGKEVNHFGNAVAYLPALGGEQVDDVRVLP